MLHSLILDVPKVLLWWLRIISIRGVDKKRKYVIMKMERVSKGGTMRENKQVIKSVQRAIGILKSFSWDQTEIGLSEIARKNSLPKSTTHRLLRTLEGEQLVSQNKTDGRYRLAITLFELGNIAFKNIRLRKVAVPYVEKLSNETGEAVHLVVLRNEEMVVIEASPSKHGFLKLEVHVGDRAPVYTTGTGKAALAFQPEERICRILRKKRKRFTKNTIVDEERLLQELQKTRNRGYAVDDMEQEEGIRCIGAPIRDHSDRTLGAISVSGPAFRITKRRIPGLAVKVKKVAENISKELGFNLVVKEEG